MHGFRKKIRASHAPEKFHAAGGKDGRVKEPIFENTYIPPGTSLIVSTTC